MNTKESRSKPVSPRASIKRSFSIRTRATKSFLINLDDLAEPLVAIPPDGGWGWVIVGVSFLIMFCIDGLGYCFALFFEDISKEFQCDITEIAVVSSLIGGFYFLAGPITCSAINRLGFQPIAIVGGAIAAASFLTASFTNTLVPFLLSIGLFGGTAFNLIYTPSVIAIGFYFEKWRGLAMAICCCGSSLGVMFFPIIVVHVFGNLSWRTIFRIISGVFIVCGLLGLTFKPIKSAKVERTVQFGEVSQITSYATMSSESEVKATGGIFVGIFQRFKNTLYPTISEVSVYKERSRTSSLGYNYYMRRQDDEAVSAYIQPDNSYESVLKSVPIHGQDPGAAAQEEIEKSGCIKKCRNFFTRCCNLMRCRLCCAQNYDVSVTTINRPLYRDDIFYAGSVFTLPRYPKRADSPASRVTPSLAYTLSVSRAPTQRDLEQQRQCVCCPEAFVRVLATMLHFQMLKSPTFIVLLLSGYLSLMGTYIVFTYLPSYAVEKGLGPKFSTMLLSVIGVANTVGRAGCGVVSCFPVLDLNIISWITISISGCVVIFSVFAKSATHHVIIYVVFGFTLAPFAVLRAIMFVELFGLENLTNCFGLNMVFQSLAAFSATPMANFILYSTDSFAIVFIFTGVSILVSGVMLIPIKCILRWEQRRIKKVTFN